MIADRQKGYLLPLSLNHVDGKGERVEMGIEQPFTPFPVTPWFFGKEWMPRPQTVQPWIPKINIFDSGSAIVIVVELPGVDINDIDISLNDDALIIEGQRREPDGIPASRYYLKECPIGKFRRHVVLPNGSTPKSIDAVLGDGILQITLWKAGTLEEAKHIAIRKRLRSSL